MVREVTRRPLIDAERHVPEILQNFLVDLEGTTHSSDVWRLIVSLGRTLNLPYIDFISASNYVNWKKTLFIRTSYDSTWLHAVNKNPDLAKWSYFRTHAMHCLTPIAVGLEFVDEYHHIPEERYKVLREAAARGIRSGFSIPLRVHAPPQSALLTFGGGQSKREMKHIIQTQGWVLNTAAVMGHHRYMMHFSSEFTERNAISDKQLELLKMIGTGMQDKNIAEELGVTVSAVRQRMKQILNKTGLGNRAELAALAMSMGLLPDPLSHLSDDEDSVLVEMGISEAGNGKVRHR